MRILSKPVTVLASGALLGALLGATAAAAPPTVAAGDPWPGEPVCAQGTITAGRSTGSQPQTPLLVYIEPCKDTKPPEVAAGRWALGLYTDKQAFVSRGGIYQFPSAGAAAGHTSAFDNASLSVGDPGALRAACLVTQPNVRIYCVAVNSVISSGASFMLTVTPLSTQDKLVDTPVVVLPDSHTMPECAGCVYP